MTDRIVELLSGYKAEAEWARRSGPNARDATWEENWDLYWGRYDFSDKADWQSKQVMPEASVNVDRWAASLREALKAAGEWFSVEVYGDREQDLAPHIRKLMDYLLCRCGRGPTGQVIGFDAVFEDLMKSGAISALGAAVTWKGYVAVEAVDARTLWVDHTGRGLYRIRRVEIDKHALIELADLEADGEPLYDRDAIMSLTAFLDEQREAEKTRSSGTASESRQAARTPIVLDEYLATVVDGDEVVEDGLFVVANERWLIRGPEKNPFWHNKDWVVFTPMITVPFSIYGRSYVESWSSVAWAFIDLTNMILDGVMTSTLNAFAASPSMLEDPTELDEGVHANKVFQLAEGVAPRDFMREIELGNLPPESIRVWEALKREIREGAMQSEIALGQMAQGEKSATEIAQSSQNSAGIIKSIAETIEQRLLEPVLDLVFKTALQHLDFASMERELGETARVFAGREQEIVENVSFKVRGISGLISRGQNLKNLLSALQVIGGNELLMQAFVQKYDAGKTMDEILRMSGVEADKLQVSGREARIASMFQQPQQAPQGSPPAISGNALSEVG